MKDLIFAAGTVCALLLVSGESSSPPRQRGFLKRTIAIGAEVYHYQVFLPFGWQPQKTWPVVLFLHGNGERGDDGWRQTRVGIGPAIRRDPERVPAVVVLPQCRRGMWWTHAPMERLALAALEAAIQEFGGDPTRVFLTGISMGGYGTWSLAAKYPGKFAALAPICGGVVPPAGIEVPEDHPPVEFSPTPYRSMAARIGPTPVWIFHGTDDPRVPVSESRKMAEALQALGKRVRFSEYVGVGHDSWDQAYEEPEFFPWLLSHRVARP